MKIRDLKYKTGFGRRGRNGRGFTLVELVVILIIIAILAAAGIATAIGYVKRAKFDKNNQSAITVYQTAQGAIANKTANGTIESWIMNLPGFDKDEITFSTESETNFSQHKVISLTYNHLTPSGDEDDYLYNLLSPYVYYPTVFSGTMAVEFDICITKDNGHLSYTANVVSAFYSQENNSPEGGWDSSCLGDSEDGLPERKESYRRSTSLVGYYSGSDDDFNVVSSVTLPWDSDYEIEGHVVGPVDGDRQASGYLFNLRNAESLDVSWAIFDEDRDPEREDDPDYTYKYSLNELHDENLFIYIYDYSNPDNKVELLVTPEALEEVSYGPVTTIYEVVDGIDISRECSTGFITIGVLRGKDVDNYIDNVNTTPDSTKVRKYTFPITKCIVKGDPRTGCPADIDTGYCEYRLSLDTIRVRSTTAYSDTNTGNYLTYFGSNRLFGNATPKNICAMLGEASTWNYTDNKNATQTKTDLYNTYAARAVDDPVYLEGAGMHDGELKYCYQVKEHCGRYDGEDNNEMYEDYVITGMCVVNTFFGDKVYDNTKDSAGKTHYIGGTVWNDEEKAAVLTNCRHLYNIGSMTSNDVVTYRIVSDINWYYHEKSDGKDYYASEVRVFTKTDYNSTVASDGSLRVVSFPAISVLKSNFTLTSNSDLNKRIYSINNIQLRRASFINNTDAGYALICSNEGKIYNLYANNISNVMESVEDGAPSDYKEICQDTAVTISGIANGIASRPSAALIGINKGIVGSSDESSESKNTVRVSNCVVMSGGYWKYDTSVASTGGVIGENNERSDRNINTFGVIEVGGSFVVVGYTNTGGIIGNCKASLGARLVVDGSNMGKSEFGTKYLKLAGNEYDFSCAVLSNFRAGGAIGYFDGASRRYFAETGAKYSRSGNDFVALDDTDFNIVVNLPEDGFIVHYEGGKNDSCSGGAIGCLGKAAGEYLSIRTDISGTITSATTGTLFSYCGGAIGKEGGNTSVNATDNCIVEEIYLDCTNNAGSLIGAIDKDYGGTVSGGAIGKFNTNTTNLKRTVAINVVNNGTVSARGAEDGAGAGGAVGGAERSTIPFIIRVVNKSESVIIGYGDDRTRTNGTGGAIGGFGATGNDNCILPDETWIYVENYGRIEGRNQVGGAIGNSCTNRGTIYAFNYDRCTISGRFFVGGAVGRNIKNQYGSVYSTLNGAKVTGTSFVGGAIGRCTKLHSGSLIKTSVTGSSEVSASEYFAGGVGGDVCIPAADADPVIDLEGTSSNPELTVKSGLDGAGGSVGILRSQNTHSVVISMPSQADLDRLVVLVDGRDCVGGAVGKLMSSTNNNYENNDPDKLINQAANKDIKIVLSVVLNPKSHVIGTGDNVGGAIGYIHTTGGKFTGRINVSSVYGSSEANVIPIQGNKNVGGVVGRIDKPVPNYTTDPDAGIFADFTSYPVEVKGLVSDEASDANVGGAIGYIYGESDSGSTLHFPVSALLGKSVISSGGANVGGVIGNNNGSLSNCDIYVSQSIGGVIKGGGKVGGAIGKNYCKQPRKIYSVTAFINGAVTGEGTGVGVYSGSGLWAERRTAIGTGDCVGGAIGYNFAIIDEISATVEGTVSGKADSVGGAVGYCHSDSSKYWLLHVKSNLQGNAEIKGVYNVGGAIGQNIANIYEIKTTIIGTAHIIGDMRVGGSVGFASARPNTGGDDVRKGNYWGRIDIINTKISADYALQGNSRIGGAVGQQGDKWGSGSNYISAALLRIEAELNTAYLFKADETGPDDANGNACVGGVFGIFVDGRVGGNYTEFALLSNGTWGSTGKTMTADGVILSGTGGLVSLDYPNRTYTNAILIAAKGRSVGGVIGQIGVEAQSQSDTWLEQNVCMSDIRVADNGPDICVVSVNGADRIGGWIGSGFAAHGGIGADNTTDPMVTYNVNTVKAVFSRGDYVGGFCGYSCAYNSTGTAKNYTHAQINVVLDNASIIGRTSVGGAFGGAACCNFNQGLISVSLINRTNVGDIVDNVLPGDKTDYDAICYEAGGVFGSVTNVDRWEHTRTSKIEIPVTVIVDATSRISGYGEEDSSIVPASETGVGGVFGRCRVTLNDAASIRVTSIDSGNTAVFSKNTNAGGIAGVLNTGSTLKNCSAVISVTTDGDGVCAGGIIGKMLGGTVMNSHSGADSTFINGTDPVIKDYNYFVAANGSNAFAGGFAGFAASGVSIEKCYTSFRVSALKGTAAGGFVGQADAGTYKNNYVSGHTYSGQYLLNAGDVTCAGNTGGFAGQTTGKVSFTDCYSTASVFCTGLSLSYAGGFIGSRDDATTITKCYSTGLVTGSNETVTGAFAGYSATNNYSGPSYAMKGINNGKDLVGSAGTVTINNLKSVESSAIKGSGDYSAYPFDAALGPTYELRAVINNEHWGDWPIAGSGDTSIADEELIISLENGPFEYDKDGVTVNNDLHIFNNMTGQYLELDTDYTLTYFNNDRVGEAQVMIAGIGEYYGAVTIPFTITAKSVKEAEVEINKPYEAEMAEFEFSGAPVVPDIKVTVDDDVLTMNVDYVLTYYRKEAGTGEYVITDDHTSIGELKVVVNGIGNYTDAADMSCIFNIIGRNINDAEVTLTNATAEELGYTGLPITPGIVVRIDGRTLVMHTDDTMDSDYTVEYSDNVHAGEASITISPVTEEYSGKKVVHFTITTATNKVTNEAVISDWTWKEDPGTLTGEFKAKFGEPVYSVYSESTCTDPDQCSIYRVKPGNDDGELYDLMKNLNAGNYYLLAEACPDDEYPDDFTIVSMIVPFSVNKADITGKAEVTLDYTATAYTGEEIKPGVNVTYKSETLSPEYYDIEYDSDTINAGTKTVTITGKGNCTGTVTAEYTINPVFTVKFFANYGSSDEEAWYTTSAESGKSVIAPENTPERDGYRFAGWYNNASCIGNPYDFNSHVSGNLELYAKWIKVYTITFVLYEEDGSDKVTTELKEQNEILEKPDDPVRPGYVFAGWYSNAEGEGTDNPWGFGNPVQDNYNIYAHWTARNDIEVTFDFKDGRDEVRQTLTYPDCAQKPVDPERDGYVFKGWFTDEEFTNPFDFALPVPDSITLYAKWEEVQD